MPIKVPDNLPAQRVLENEGVLVMREEDAVRQDIRPLKIAILNLMPLKIKTETQIARVLGISPLQIEITLISPSDYEPRNTPREHMLDFYKTFNEVRDERFDGLIITGAPIEQMPFEDVEYWDELQELFEWSRTHVHGLFNLCWGAQAALYHFHDIPKYQLPEKRFGIFRHRVLDHTSMLTRGLNDDIAVPVSRHTENRREDFAGKDDLEIIMDSDEAGLCLVFDKALRHVHMFNHLEYDSETLDAEYRRDLERGDTIQLPKHYYPGDNPDNAPINVWRGNAHLLFGNWINFIYQTTPYNLDAIGADEKR